MEKSSRKKFLLRLGIIALLTLLIPTSIIWWIVAQPTWKSNQLSSVTIESQRLKAHVVTLSETFHPRNFQHPKNLEKCAEYIHEQFVKAGATKTEFQEYQTVDGRYKNVVGIFGEVTSERIVVGAHYDSCGKTPGADDNASGVAGLIELAYLWGKKAPTKTVELVAYTLEEPPYFDSSQMGSFHHAKRCGDEKIQIPVMICLEMIGYFTDEPGSQDYPVPFLRAIYPTVGNFIALASRMEDKAVTKKLKILMKGTSDLPIYSINAPGIVQGIDYSDHRNYWPHGYPAVMITDSAFYRNVEYHKEGDTFDRLDYDKMGKVAIAVYEAVNGW